MYKRVEKNFLLGRFLVQAICYTKTIVNNRRQRNMQTYITLTGLQHYYGVEVLKVNDILRLEKEPNNPQDDEAIKVTSINGILYGYVANSLYTRAKGTQSAGKIAHLFDEECTIRVMFIWKDSAIAEVIQEEKIGNENKEIAF